MSNKDKNGYRGIHSSLGEFFDNSKPAPVTQAEIDKCNEEILADIKKYEAEDNRNRDKFAHILIN